jgi:formylglycine-generating enzyme
MKRLKHLCAISVILVTVTAVAHADTFGSGANSFDIEFATIGNPGNAADTTGAPNPAGQVDYAYRIGKFEISEQMIDNANLLGGLGITKDTRGPDKPATSTSWNEAARFVNWLNTTSGSTPAYKFAVQPGEANYIANANIELWTAGDAGYNPSNLYRNSSARYFLPSVDEWYKAAYYDPTSGVYYEYPTRSDSAPDGTDFEGDPLFDAVYFDGFNQGGPNDITNAGVLSPYGTMGQGGNVNEWQETDVDLLNGPTPSSSNRVARGGYWAGSLDLVATRRLGVNPSVEFNIFGFRVASTAVPEPSTLLLIAAGVGSCMLRRRRNYDVA